MNELNKLKIKNKCFFFLLWIEILEKKREWGLVTYASEEAIEEMKWVWELRAKAFRNLMILFFESESESEGLGFSLCNVSLKTLKKWRSFNLVWKIVVLMMEETTSRDRFQPLDLKCTKSSHWIYVGQVHQFSETVPSMMKLFFL